MEEKNKNLLKVVIVLWLMIISFLCVLNGRYINKHDSFMVFDKWQKVWFKPEQKK